MSGSGESVHGQKESTSCMQEHKYRVLFSIEANEA